MTTDCIFCRIVSGDLPSAQAYSDDHVLAFADINAVAPIHTLVIPKEHVTFLEGMTAEQEPLLGHLLRAAAEVAREQKLIESGYRLVINQGADAGQMVDHLHVHILGGRTLGSMV